MLKIHPKFYYLKQPSLIFNDIILHTFLCATEREEQVQSNIGKHICKKGSYYLYSSIFILKDRYKNILLDCNRIKNKQVNLNKCQR